MFLMENPDVLSYLVHNFHDMDGDSDYSRLLGQSSGYCLANPPGGVGRKLVSQRIIELINRTKEAEITFLDEIKEKQPAVCILFCYTHDEPQIGFDQGFPSIGIFLQDSLCEGDLFGLGCQGKLGQLLKL